MKITRTVILSLLVAVSASVASAGVTVAPGDPAPDVYVRDFDGRHHRMGWSQRRATVINFWAEWCAPCRAEMPVLERIYREHAADGFGVIGIHVGAEPAEALPFLEELEITYPVYRSDPRLAEAWGGIGLLPTSYLVGADGVVLRRYVGATEEQVEGLIRDVEAILNGEPLGNPVIPEVPSTSTQP